MPSRSISGTQYSNVWPLCRWKCFGTCMTAPRGRRTPPTNKAAQISINIGIAPPAPHYEVVPSMAIGYVWAPGYWAWSGERHIWMRGRPIIQRTGHHWAPDRWEQHGDHYYRHEGRWEYDEHDKPKKHKKEKKEKKEKHANKHDR